MCGDADAVEIAVGRLASLGDAVQRDVALGPMTTYRVGGAAALYVRVTDRAQLAVIADAAQASGLPVLVVGRGSNLLVADGGFAGLAVGLAELDDTVDIDTTTARVTASAGVALPVLARKTAAAGLSGFEWAVGVPGSIGGAVRMNAGGHGSDMAASLVEVTVHDLDLGAERTLAAAELGLAFRSSALGPAHVVLDAVLQLQHGDAERVRSPDRRDRGLAARESARRAERRLGVRQPGARRGQRRSVDRCGRAARPASRHRDGVRQARQLHPGRRGWTSRRRARTDDRGSTTGRGVERVPPAQRDQVGRLRRR